MMTKLSLGEWASVAEIVAALGVIVSLLFVGLEVRHNTRAVQAATLQSVIGIARGGVLLLASDSDLNHIVMLGDSDISKLTPEQRMRYAWQDRSFWLGMQTIYRQWELGVLPSDEWDVYRKVICLNIAVQGERALWPQNSSLLIPAFVQVVQGCDSFRSTPTGAVIQLPSK